MTDKGKAHMVRVTESGFIDARNGSWLESAGFFEYTTENNFLPSEPAWIDEIIDFRVYPVRRIESIDVHVEILIADSEVLFQTEPGEYFGFETWYPMQHVPEESTGVWGVCRWHRCTALESSSDGFSIKAIAVEGTDEIWRGWVEKGDPYRGRR